MKNTIKLAVIALLLAFATGLKAQDKYDYAIIKLYKPVQVGEGKAGIYVSMSGKELERVELKKEQFKPFDDTPLLNYASSMTDKGWRVINSTIEAGNFCLTLEKKKN